MMAEQELWQPSADVETLRARARLLQRTRLFFDQRAAMEVETPVLSHFAGTDVQLLQWRTEQGLTLHTSPEFAMKRLLAAGSGDIYQLCRVFRQDETGVRHNPEFTMLEWYRLGMDEFELMSEVAALIEDLAGNTGIPQQRLSYRQAFLNAGLADPFQCSIDDLRTSVHDHLNSDSAQWQRDECLDALMALVVEPSLPAEQLTFIYHYPASQAALAQHSEQPEGKVARRFELYWQGLELANGYFELTDSEEQQRRFEQENKLRREAGLPQAELDQNFLSALKAGMPVCSGVALGFDRLIMLLLGKQRIEQVLSFDFNRA